MQKLTLITALATPFDNGKIDYFSYTKLVNYQLDSGVQNLLCLGTTAEAPLLSHHEKRLLLGLTRRLTEGRAKLWVGIGANSTPEIKRQAKWATDLGAEALLLAPPSFSKCTTDGYVQHILAVLKETPLPLMLYDAPNRCGYTLPMQVVDATKNNLWGVKTAGEDLQFVKQLAKQTKAVCGNDSLLCQQLAVGAQGAVSVVSNVAPQLTAQILNTFERHGTKKAQKIAKEEIKLFATIARVCNNELNPIAIKHLLHKKGIFATNEVRLPLTAANGCTRAMASNLNLEEIL